MSVHRSCRSVGSKAGGHDLRVSERARECANQFESGRAIERASASASRNAAFMNPAIVLVWMG